MPKTPIYFLLFCKSANDFWEYAKVNGKVWETFDKAEAQTQAKRLREKGYQVKLKQRMA